MESKKCKKKPELQPLTKAVVNAMCSEGRGKIRSDIMGSYTGTPEQGEVPEQDADDL